MPKKKKGGKKKGKGAKKVKLTDAEKKLQGLSEEQKMQELVELGILQDINRSKTVRMQDFVGEGNNFGFTADSMDDHKEFQPDPTIPQVRQWCTEFGVIPLGSEHCRAECPLVPAILLYGPKGSGKTMLTRGIANAVGARWFDLSPDVLAKVENMNAKECSRIITLTFQMAEYLQPSVVYVDEFDQILKKGKVKKAGFTPQTMKKELLSQKDKKCKKKNRILIIGNAREPFHDDVDQGEIKACFVDASKKGQEMSLMCYVPYPDYMTRIRLWTQFLKERGIDVVDLERSKSFSLNTLAFISEGYTAGGIKRAVTTLMTDRRIQKFHELDKQFETSEFVNALSKTLCSYQEQHAKFQEFTAEVSGRTAYLEFVEAAMANPEDGGGDKKKGKKGKKGK